MNISQYTGAKSYLVNPREIPLAQYKYISSQTENIIHLLYLPVYVITLIWVSTLLSNPRGEHNQIFVVTYIVV